MGKHTFSKPERLNKENWIKELFKKGSSFNLYPFRVIYYAHPDPAWLTHQLLISVSARNFKKSVDRNALKRRIREGYRLHKPTLIAPKKLLVAYIYTAKEKLTSSVIHEKLIRSLSIISDKESKKEAN
jgi:ribonuclease P protein component